MKNFTILSKVFFAVVVGTLLLGVTGYATTFTISSNTNWSAIAGGPPTANDAIIVNSQAILTVNVTTAICASITLGQTGSNNSGILAFSAGTSKVIVVGTLTDGATSGNKTSLLDMTNGGTLVCRALVANTTGSFTQGSGTIRMGATNTLPATIFTSFNSLVADTGTTTLGVAIAVGGDLTISSGATLSSSASNFNISVTGNYSNSGTFTAGTNTVTFNATTTGHTLTGTMTGSSKFNNLTFSGAGGAWSFAANSADVGGVLSITNGTVTAPSTTLQVAGNFTHSGGTFTHNSGTVNMNGGGAQTLGGTSSSTFSTLKINNTVGVTLGIATTTTNLTIGDVTASSIFSDGGFQLTASGTLTLTSGSFSLGSAGSATTWPGFGTNSITAGTTVTYASGAGQTVSIVPGYSNLTFSGAGTKTVASGTLSIGSNWSISSSVNMNTNNPTVNVTGNMTISSGTVTSTSGTLSITGNYSNSGTFANNAGTVTFNATTTGHTLGGTMTTTSSFNNLTFNGVGGAWSFGANSATVAGTLTITNGTVTAPSTTLTLTSNYSNSGTFTHNSGTVLFNSTVTGRTLSGSMTGSNGFNILTFNGSGGAWSFGSNSADVASTFTITAGTVTAPSGTLTIAGNYSNAGTFTHNSGTVTFNGTTTISGASTNSFNNVTVSGTLTGPSAANMNVAGNWVNNGTFTHNSGTVTFNGTTAMSGSSTNTFNNVTISGTLTAPSGNMNVASNWSNSGTFTHNSGTVTFTSTATGKTLGGTMTGSSGFNNLTFNGSGGAWSFAGNSADVANDFTITLGTVTAPSTILTVTGNWANSGTFTNNSGTVKFNGTTTLSGSSSNTFNNVTMNGGLDCAGKATVNGTFQIDGGNINNSNPATYGASSTLKYNTTYSLFDEWRTGTGPGLGLPANVTVAAGTLTMGADASSRTAAGSVVVATGATLTQSTSDLNLSGDFTLQGTAVFNPGSLTVTFTGSNAENITASSVTFDNLTINKASNSVTMGGNVTSSTTLTLTSGALSIGANTLTLNGSVSQTSGTLTGGASSNITFGGAGAATSLPAVTLNNLTINRATGINMSGSVTAGGTLTLTSGTFAVGGNTLSLNGPAIAGTATNLSATSSSSLSFGGSSASVAIPSSVVAINNLTIGNSSGVSLNSDLVVSGTYTPSSGALSIGTQTLTLNGSVPSGSGTFSTTSSSNLVFGGSASGVNVPGGTGSLNDFTLNNSNGATLNSNPVVSGTYTPTAGALSVGAHTLTLNGPVPSGAGTLTTTSSSNLSFGGSSTGVNVPGGVGALNNFTLNNSNGATLNSSPTINGTLTTTSGNLTTGANTVTLASTGSLSEAAGATVQGNVTTTRSVPGVGGTVTFGNIGADVTLHGTALGSTAVTRVTGSASTGNGNNSIKRRFTIAPATNTGLNADLLYHYDETNDLNGQNEATLEFYKSTDAGSTWTNQDGSVNTVANTILVTGVNDFSEWTASDASNALGDTPTPTTTSLSPSSRTAGDVGFTLTVNGTGFVNGKSTIRVNGSDYATTYVSTVELTASIPASDIDSAGSLAITVFNTGGGGLSNSQTLTINKASTTTVVTSSLNPSVTGESVTFKATVSINPPGSGTFTGSVRFSFDGTPQTPVALSGDSATISTSFNATGSPHSVTATYLGDANFDSSTSSAFSQNVNKGATSTSISQNIDPTVFGQSVTFKALVSVNSPAVGTPTGNVTFRVDGVDQTPVALTADSALFSISSIPVTGSPHAISAHYDGNGDFDTSRSSNAAHTVNQATTTTALVSSVNPSVWGESVSFKATVSVTAPGSGTPTGTVTFTVDGTPETPVAMTGDSAVYSTSSLSVSGSPHSVYAHYDGSSDFDTSLSSTVSQVVNKANSQTLLTSNDNPSVFEDTVTFTAKVSAAPPGAGSPSGTITFIVDGTPGSPIALSGDSATYSTPTLTAGAHNIRAAYSGDGDFNLDTSSTLVQTVDQKQGTMSLVTSGSPTTYEDTVTFTAHVTNGSNVPTGTIEFYDGATSIGSSGLDGTGHASVSTHTLTAGSHTIKAVYGGDVNFKADSATVGQTVNQRQAHVTTLLSDENPSTYEDTVTFTAHVTNGTFVPTGTVTFYDGASPIGSSAVNGSGNASIEVFSLLAGPHTIKSVYGGDINFLADSNTLVQNVDKRQAHASILPNHNPIAFEQWDTVTVHVTNGVNVPTGTIDFYDGASLLASAVALDGSGNAKYADSTFAVGSHTIKGVYSGDSNFLADSASYVQTVDKATPVLHLSSNLNASVYEDTVTFSVTVTNGSHIPTGSVEFFDGVSSLGVQSLVAGFASVQTADLTAGSHTIKASYGGDGDFMARETTLTQVVNTHGAHISLLSSATTRTFEDTVRFTATVTNNTTTPTGNVAFYYDATHFATVALVGGTAIDTTNALPAGIHVIKAVYLGDNNFTADSTTIGDTVNQRQAHVATIGADHNPSVFEQHVTVTAHVTNGIFVPTGTVSFYDGGTLLVTSALNGSGNASYLDSTFAVGGHTIKGVYSGDSNFLADSASYVQTVNKATSTVQIVSSSNPSTFEDTVRFSVTVSNSFHTPTGTVEFFDGASSMGTKTLSSGSAAETTFTLTAGSHTIKAVYSGDGDFVADSAQVVQVVHTRQGTMSLLSSLNPSVYNDTVRYHAHVSNGANVPTGSITFYVDGGSIGNVAVDGSGDAYDSSFTLTAGVHSIKAVYGGDANFKADSATLSQTVNKATATLSLSNLTHVYDGSPKSATATTAPPSLSGVALTYNGSGTAPTNVGNYQVVASLTNANYQATNDTAVFKIRATITASAGSNGSISPSGAIVVDAGVDTTFTITPASGYHTDSLIVDGTPIALSGSHTFTNVSASHTIRVTFAVNTFTITASAGAHGAISPVGSVAVTNGGSQLFSFTPDTGYHVDSLYIDNTPHAVAPSFTFTNVLATHSIRVTFTIDTLIITATAGAHGTITPSGSVHVTYGSDKAFAFAPATGYHIDSVFVDGVQHVGALAETLFNVKLNHTVRVVFAINTFTIIASAGPHGTITPSDTVTVNYGATQTFTFTPASGYGVDSVFVDGTGYRWSTDFPPPPPETPPGYGFGSVSANHTISVTFAVLPSYSATFRTFVYDSLIVAKAIKKKPVTEYWEFNITNHTGAAVSQVNITFANAVSTIVSSDTLPATMGSSNKIWVFNGNLSDGGSFRIKGITPKAKAQTIAKMWFGAVDKTPDATKVPANVSIAQLPMPNAANVRDDVFGRALTAQGGLLVGVVRTDSLKFLGWVRMKKSADMYKSLFDKTAGKHTDLTTGFRTFIGGKAFIKELTSLSPKKQDNRVFADLMTLKFNIALSALGTTPRGFGELRYVEAGSPFVNMLVRDIATYADTMMTNWTDPRFNGHSELYGQLDTTLMHINSAFSVPFDTVSWSDTLKVKGTIKVVDTGILTPTSVPPMVIVPLMADGENAEVPKTAQLYQNYPNPFNPTTNIQFDLPNSMVVTLKIYNMLGQEVATLYDRQELTDGNQEVQFDGSSLASGVYFYRIIAEPIADEDGNIQGSGYIESKKMVLIK